MMKRYIKPTTDMYAVAAQQMMAGSGGIEKGDGTPTSAEESDAKGVGFFTDPESAEKNEYPVYNLWED